MSTGVPRRAGSTSAAGVRGVETRLPAGIRAIRRARPEDAEAICALQQRLLFREDVPAEQAPHAWLIQKDKPTVLARALALVKDAWIAEGPKGEIAAYQVVTTPRYCSRSFVDHTFLPEHAGRARDVLRSGDWLYMSQVAVAPEFAGHGLAKVLQGEVLQHYRQVPLLAHVAVMTQKDFRHLQAGGERGEVRGNNVGSHRFHLRQGYVPVAYTSDLRGSIEYSHRWSGHQEDDDGLVGLLYMNFRDGRAPACDEHLDTVGLVLQTPRDPDHPDDGPGWETMRTLELDTWMDGEMPHGSHAVALLWWSEEVARSLSRERDALRRAGDPVFAGNDSFTAAASFSRRSRPAGESPQPAQAAPAGEAKPSRK